jgi:hypothetical protein
MDVLTAQPDILIPAKNNPRDKGGHSKMANDVTFEGKERRMEKIKVCMKKYGIESLEAAKDLCLSKGIDVDKIVKGIQPYRV